ncbi:MAG: flagellar biosynthesis anti-sigma factor FlgM [Ideonella sp.]
MKIGNPLDKPGLPPVTANRGKPTNAGSSTAAAAGGSSTVALSTAATSLINGSEAAGVSAADFDQAKVDRISNAISQGQYKVNPEAIADKLLANAQELLSRPH